MQNGFVGPLLIGFLLGIAAAWFYFRERIKSAAAQARSLAEKDLATALERTRSVEERMSSIEREKQSLLLTAAEKVRLETQLQEERKVSAEKLALIEQAKENLADAFKALSAQALQSNNESFIILAKATLEKFQESARGDLEKKKQAITELVGPVRESLQKFDEKVQLLENARVSAYARLTQQVDGMMTAQKELQQQTGNLVQALRTPAVRGRWGELQLKRVLELAGMLEHCDFEQQTSVDTEEGRRRPDVCVRLPAGRCIVIDAKVPLEAYLGAIECTDETLRRVKFKDHAQQVRTHLNSLARKSYWQHFEHTPEFVVLFLPGESLFSAALEADPSLIEADEKVVLATPTTLIAVLRAIAHGWKEVKLAEHAQAISELGRELHKRVADVTEHWVRLGKNLGLAVESYNRAVSSLETRFLPSARRFTELKAGSEKEIEIIDPIDQHPRMLVEQELGELFGAASRP